MPSPTPPIKAGSLSRPIIATSTSGTVMLESIIGQESCQICRQLVWASWWEAISGLGIMFGIYLGGDKITAGWTHIVFVLSCDGPNN